MDSCWVVWQSGSTESYRCLNCKTAAEAALGYLEEWATCGEYEISVSQLYVPAKVYQFKLTKSIHPIG